MRMIVGWVKLMIVRRSENSGESGLKVEEIDVWGNK